MIKDLVDASGTSTTTGNVNVQYQDTAKKESYIHTMNGRIACGFKPIEAIPTKKVGAMYVVNQKMGLTPLTVLYDSENKGSGMIRAGSTVYVYTSSLTLHWAKEVVEFNGVDMIFVPETEIRMLQKA